jgi:hypothetical protein
MAAMKAPPSAPSDPLRNRPNYLDLLWQGAPPPRLPFMELLRQGEIEQEQRRAEQEQAEQNALRDFSQGTLPAKLDYPLSEALAALLTYTLASGRDRISSREIFRRLRLSSSREAAERRLIAQCLRSLGWVRVRWGKDEPGKRIWGWRWREWNVSQVKVDLDT